MTVIVAARYGDEIIVGADSQTTKGNDRRGVTSKSFSKIVETKHSLIGFAGLGKAATVVQEMLKDEKYLRTAKNYLKFRSESDVLKFSRDVWTILKDEVESAFSVYPEECLAAEMLVASKEAIFRVNTYDDITVCDRFESIGSGEDLAIGAISVLYEQVEAGLMDLSRAVQRSVQVACEYSTSCGLPVHLKELK